MASAPVATDLDRETSAVASGVSRAAAVVSGFSRTRSRAEVLWLAFVIVQALDGALSYIGVFIHGPGIEANPLVAWYMTALGPAIGFTAAKLFAVSCGAVLYLTARHQWVAALTLVYLVFAVGPWMHLLSRSS